MNFIKKAIIALMVVLTAAGAAEAKIIGFGIKAGLNVNKISLNKDIAKSDNSCGWTAGVMADVNIPLLGFGADVSLMYARMNNAASATYDQNGVAIGANNSLYGKNFLEIPVNIKYKISLPVVGSLVAPYVFTGPNFAFCLDKSYQDSNLGLKSKAFQMAWNVGIGLEFLKHLQIGASYGFGCNNIVEKIGVVDASKLVDSKAKNNYWTVTAAYIF